MGIAILTVVILLAVFGLLFYWLKSKRSISVKGDGMAGFGVAVANHSGQLVNITDRPVMISDIINVTYGVSGSATFNKNISSVSVMASYDFDVEHDGKAIQVTYSGNKVFWHWVPAKTLKTNSVSVFVFYS